MLETLANACVLKKNWYFGEKRLPKVAFKEESGVEHIKPQPLFWHLKWRYPMSTNFPILNQGKKKAGTVTCNIDGATLYWYDLVKSNLDGSAIAPGTHA